MSGIVKTVSSLLSLARALQSVHGADRAAKMEALPKLRAALAEAEKHAGNHLAIQAARHTIETIAREAPTPITAAPAFVAASPEAARVSAATRVAELVSRTESTPVGPARTALIDELRVVLAEWSTIAPPTERDRIATMSALVDMLEGGDYVTAPRT